MDTITIETQIDAPPEAVWQVLDDFGSIDRWSPGVRRSRLESSGPIGVGTTRHCDFAPFGSAKETIEEYVPQQRMRVSLGQIETMPISAADVVFTLDPIPQGTRLGFAYSYTVAPRARLFRSLLPRLFRGGLGKLVDALKGEAERVYLMGEESEG
jgi:uncharacterized protein YndB with AHSA1/START domain